MSPELAEMKKKYDALVNAVRDIDAKATPYGEDDDGFTTAYVMPVGPLHRALGMIAGWPYGDGECRVGSVVFHVLLGERHGDGQWDAVLVPQQHPQEPT